MCSHPPNYRTSTKGAYQEWGNAQDYRYIEICLECRALYWSLWYTAITGTVAANDPVAEVQHEQVR